MAAEAVLKALRHVWVTLEALNVPAAVMGGIALAAWKHVRATRDIDLLISPGSDDLEKILRELHAAEIRRKGDRQVRSVGGLDAIELLYEPPETFFDVQIDLLTARSSYHQRALQRRVPVTLPDLDVRIAVLTCEDLILHKLLAGRIIDRADVATLLRANQESLDRHYLIGWAEGLGLSAELAEVWKEAFPGERLPDVYHSR